MFKQEIINVNAGSGGILQQDILVIDSFFEKSFADDLHSILYNFKKWNHQDTAQNKELGKFNFSYKRKQIDLLDEVAPELLHSLHTSLNSPAVFDWIHNISGCEVNGFVGSASWLRAGNYLAAHNDSGDPRRRVTFNYYITRDWKADWGGLFVYESPRSVLTPGYNSLVLFKVGQQSWHNVTPVSKSAPKKVKRLAVTGWFYKG